MRPLVLLVALASVWTAGCLFPADDADTEVPGGGGGGPPVESAWSGDTQIGVECRLVQPEGPLTVESAGPLRLEFRLLNPARFQAVELELGKGLALVDGRPRQEAPLSDAPSIDVTVEPGASGERIAHAYFVWNEGQGGHAESCHAFAVQVDD